MKSVRSISLIILLAAASQVLGADWCDVEIDPPVPGSSDVVTIILSGMWGDSCVPDVLSASVAGNNIYLDVSWSYVPGMCFTVISPWELTEYLAPLSVGTYSVYASLDGGPYEWLTDLIVTDELKFVPLAYSTIQAAIDDCNDGDTVIIAQGTYTGAGNRDLDFLGKAITVRSENPEDPCVVAATVIDCNGSPEEPHRGFSFHSGEDTNSVLAGLTIVDGHGLDPNDPNYSGWTFGGGVYCIGSGPTITECVITNNTASQGAGIFAWKNSSPAIIKCNVSENNQRGGIYLWENTTAKITNCLISGNQVRGISLWDSPSAEISNCQIIDNGMCGIQIDGDSATINNCTISDNHGSGISCSGNVAISNCLINGNAENLWGGGIQIIGNDTIAEIKNSTITENSADSGGGGVCCSRGQITIINSIVSNNISEDIYVWTYPPPPGASTPPPTELTISYSCPGVIVVDANLGSTLILGDGNIDADPCFADADANDFHLTGSSSPCFNAGDPNYVAGPNETDIDGDERVINGRVDMGADEFEIECMAKTNPAYDNWVYWDKPDCWCYAKQCRGDADGLTFAGVFVVSGQDLNILKGALNRLEALMPEGGECADLDHKKFANIFWVSGQDLIIMKQYVNKPEISIPECGNPPDPNYNFWLSP